MIKKNKQESNELRLPDEDCELLSLDEEKIPQTHFVKSRFWKGDKEIICVSRR